jgi:phage terminase large subunit GpA-like protein
VAVFKSELYGRLRLDPPTDEQLAAGGAYPVGYVHLPKGLDAERVKQLVAEQLVSVKTKRGFQRLEWQKMRARNEMLDCRVYARAAAWLLGVAHCLDEAAWQRLELAASPLDDASTPPQAQPAAYPHVAARPAAYRRPRLAARSRWMSE